MEFDWSKLSEILLTALLSGIVAGITVYFAYLYGIKQSDRNWKRELAQREKEQKEREENDLNIRRIELLTELLDYLKTFLSAFDFEVDKNGRYFIRGFENDYMPKAWNLVWELDKIIPLFPYSYDQETHERLFDLKTQINDLSKEFDEWALGGAEGWGADG